MPRGRPRKSATEHRLAGNPSKGVILDDQFVPRGAPFVPEHLADDAKACAEHIIQCFTTKHLTAADSYALSAFSTAWAWHKAAVEEMAKPGFEPIVVGDSGMKPSPWFQIMNKASEQMLRWSAKLYLTPVDRASIRTVSGDRSKSKFDGLIGADDEIRAGH